MYCGEKHYRHLQPQNNSADNKDDGNRLEEKIAIHRGALTEEHAQGLETGSSLRSRICTTSNTISPMETKQQQQLPLSKTMDDDELVSPSCSIASTTCASPIKNHGHNMTNSTAAPSWVQSDNSLTSKSSSNNNNNNSDNSSNNEEELSHLQQRQQRSKSCFSSFGNNNINNNNPEIASLNNNNHQQTKNNSNCSRSSLFSSGGRMNSRRSLLLGNKNGDVAGSTRSLSVLTEEEAKSSWEHLDSMHSRVSAIELLAGLGVGNNGNNNGNDSYTNDSSLNTSGNLNDSCCSFASFSGGSANSDESEREIEAQVQVVSRSFQRLQEQDTAMTPRAMLLKQQSYRMQRGASFRGSLSLIQETTTGNSKGKGGRLLD